MNGCKITCYAYPDECGYCSDGWCGMYDRPCEDVHIDQHMPDCEDRNV